MTRLHDGRRLAVAAADASAQALGLRPGMALAHAQALVPGLVVADATPEADAAALERLAAWCLRIAPMTSADAPDGIWIDSTGCAHLHGGERAMLHGLVAHLAQNGLAGRLAVADTPGAAHALARHGAAPVTIVAPGGQAAALHALPVAALRLEADTAAHLRRLGLERIGQLAAAPRGPLARRFGDALLARLDAALGHVREPIRPVLPPETIIVRRGFVEPIATAEAFATVILALVAEACTRLEDRGEGARRLDLVFERVDGTVQIIRIGTARPVRDVRHLSRLLDERIEEVDPGLGVEAMRLVLSLVEPLAFRQRASGLSAAEGEPADLSELVDRLSNRLGPDSVFRLRLEESDLPERAQAAVPFDADDAAAPAVPPWPRPARLLDPPEPVQAVAMLPDHPPKAFTWRRHRHRVQRADGPERVTGEWWRRPDELFAVRDYWIVENESGRRFWLFREGDGIDTTTGDLRWFLHGLF